MIHGARDLGDQKISDTIAMLYDHLFAWTRRQSQRTTRSEAQLMKCALKAASVGL